MKKIAALVLVLIMCFSVSIGGTFANLQGQTGFLASDVFVYESNGVSITIGENQRVNLLPGATVNGEAIRVTAGDSGATVSLKFTVPTIEENGGTTEIITVTANGWTKNPDGTFKRTIPANGTETLEDFKFTLDSRVDIVNGEMVVVENGEIKPLDWNGISTGYIKLEATTGTFSSVTP